jgi:glycosyltransferase involved in cell wall biosynthesis
MPDQSICFFNSSKTWGGGEKWHFDMAMALNRKGYRVVVVAGKGSELENRLKTSGIPFHVFRISNVSFLNPLKIFRIYQILRHEKIDGIIINLSEDLKIAGIASKLAGIQHIVYRRGSAIAIKNSLSNRFIFRHCITAMIANSEHTKKTVLQNNPDLFPSNKIKVIHNGIDLSDDDRTQTQVLYQRKENEVILGNAGRLSYEKGQKDLLQVARKLKEKRIPFKLLMAGDGELKDELQALARNLDVTEEVMFKGFVENIKSFMETIDIFLLSSLWEGFGYVLIEAMAAGKPVIAFDNGTTSEIIQDEKTGFIVRDRDIEIFTEKIDILRGNDILRERMGRAGKARVHEHFDVNIAEQELETFLNAM